MKHFIQECYQTGSLLGDLKMEWSMIHCWALQEDYVSMDSPGCEFL